MGTRRLPASTEPMQACPPWPAPAKLNLFLHVLGRRSDGYHELETVFQLLDFGDLLRIESRGDGRIRRLAGLPGVPAESDLGIRAAHLLKGHAGSALGADIAIEKHIPAGGGLGGGSSDAATVLLVLNRLWKLDLAPAELAALGRRLGADVPVFVHGHSAWARGVGERLQAVSLCPAPWYAVVTPPCQVPTVAVFASASLTRDTPESTIPGFLRQGVPVDGVPPALDVAQLLAAGHNDCEPVVRSLYPPVGAALGWLGTRGEARLTGTGASVFAPFAGEDAAHAALAGLPAGWNGFAARGVDRSPLLASLAASGEAD